MVLLYSYMCVWVFWCVERPLLGQPWRMGHLLRPSLHFTQRQCILAFVNHHTIRTTNTKNIFAANNAHIDFQTLDIAKAINSSLKSQRCEWGIYYVEAHNGFQLTDPLSLSLSAFFFLLTSSISCSCVMRMNYDCNGNIYWVVTTHATTHSLSLSCLCASIARKLNQFALCVYVCVYLSAVCVHSHAKQSHLASKRSTENLCVYV